jgi:hypothetical protein
MAGEAHDLRIFHQLAGRDAESASREPAITWRSLVFRPLFFPERHREVGCRTITRCSRIGLSTRKRKAHRHGDQAREQPQETDVF